MMMMDVGRNAGSTTLPSEYTEQLAQQINQLGKELSGQGAGTLGNIDSAKTLAELARLQQTMQSSSPREGVPGVSSSNGAPVLEGATLNLSADDMAALLIVLQSKTKDAQLRTAQEGLQIAQNKTQQSNERAIGKIKEMNEKAAEADTKDKVMHILGWIGKVAGFVAAVAAMAIAIVATIATSGAAAPLIAFAALALVSSTITLASAVSQELGGPPLEISYLLNTAMSAMLEGLGMDKEDAEKYGKILAGAVGIMTGAVLVDPALAGDLAAGIALVAGADQMTAGIIGAVVTVAFVLAVSVVAIACTGGTGIGGAAASAGAGATNAAANTAGAVSKTAQVATSAASAADKAIRVATTAARVAQAVSGIIQGATAATTGGLGIAKAVDERDIESKRADKKDIDALITKLQAQMEEDREEIRKVLEQIMQGYSVVSQMFTAAADSRMQISSNMGGRNHAI